MKKTKIEQREREAFLRWQKTYNSDFHGYIEPGEALSLENFEKGGIRGHDAPRCSMCDPTEAELEVEKEYQGIWPIG